MAIIGGFWRATTPNIWRLFWVGLGAIAISAIGSAGVQASPADPARAPAEPRGSLLLAVSLNEQTLAAYRGLAKITDMPISSGRKGYGTPTGIFSILEKRVRHFSNLYDNAPMPFMQRLTWSGVALHAGYLPGYPASHGCIRLPKDGAHMLFDITDIGGHVVVTDAPVVPQGIAHPALPLPTPAIVSLASIEPPRTLPAATGKKKTDVRPIRILISPKSRVDIARDVQTRLAALGHDPGALDGILGPKTRRALKRFQEAEDLPVTGLVDADTLTVLSFLSGDPILEGKLRVRRKFKDVLSPMLASRRPMRRSARSCSCSTRSGRGTRGQALGRRRLRRARDSRRAPRSTVCRLMKIRLQICGSF